MNIIIQNLNDQTTRGLSLAFHIARFNTVLWDPTVKPIFDVFFEMSPVVLITYSSFYKEHAEEFRAAQEKYGGLIYVIGMEFDDKFAVGRTISAFANIVDSINTKNCGSKYVSDASMIVDYIRPNDHIYVQEIIRLVSEIGLSLRIYGKVKLDTPHYVGRVLKEDIWPIYKGSSFLIDLYGEHYLNPFLYGNLGICELQYRDFGEQWLNCDNLDLLKKKLVEYKQGKISYTKYVPAILEKHTNFDIAASVLGGLGLVNESLKVLEAKKGIIDEFWTRS